MLRLKWFLSDFGIPFKTLTKRLSITNFDPTEDDTDGFSLEKVTRDLIVGQHVEKMSYVHIIRLPSGASVEEPRSVFTITEFLFRNNSRLAIRITNSPRRLVNFLNSLSDLCDQELSCDTLDVDILKWIEKIEDRLGRTRVTQFDVNNIRISDTTVGRYALKGSGDIREEFARILHGKEHVIESARCELIGAGDKISFEIFRGGAVKFVQNPEEQFLRDFELCLLQAIT